MENIVPCKMCSKDFNYIPGPAGGARQLCGTCRVIADEKEVREFEEKMIVEGNKYLYGAPKRKNVYDPTEIMLNGIFPEFQSDSDRFICAVEIGEFIRANGFCGKEENIVKFLNYLGVPNSFVCMRLWPLEYMEYAAMHKAFESILDMPATAQWGLYDTTI